MVLLLLLMYNLGIEWIVSPFQCSRLKRVLFQVIHPSDNIKIL